jgi:hypothetical protein
LACLFWIVNGAALVATLRVRITTPLHELTRAADHNTTSSGRSPGADEGPPTGVESRPGTLVTQ